MAPKLGTPGIQAGEHVSYFQYRDARVRFLRRCEIVDGCWVWRGASRGAYGISRLGDRMRNAHRVAYALFKAPVPDGVSVLHNCTNKLCCNPAHLRLDVQEQHLSPLAASEAL